MSDERTPVPSEPLVAVNGALLEGLYNLIAGLAERLTGERPGILLRAGGSYVFHPPTCRVVWAGPPASAGSSPAPAEGGCAACALTLRRMAADYFAAGNDIWGVALAEAAGILEGRAGAGHSSSGGGATRAFSSSESRR